MKESKTDNQPRGPEDDQQKHGKRSEKTKQRISLFSRRDQSSHGCPEKPSVSEEKAGKPELAGYPARQHHRLKGVSENDKDKGQTQDGKNNIHLLTLSFPFFYESWCRKRGNSILSAHCSNQHMNSSSETGGA